MTHDQGTSRRSPHAPSGRGSYAVPIISVLLLLLICIPNLAVPAHAASPDLTVENVWLEKASASGELVAQLAPDDQFNIVATVKNTGDAPANGYYLDVYYDDDYGRGGPDNITLGEVQTWFVGPFSAQEGTHIARWVVDPDNQIAETSESNNLKELPFTIGSVILTTTTTSSTSSTTSSSQSTPQALALTPTSGPSGSVVSASGSSYQGTTCSLVAQPSNLFTSQTCTITAGSVTEDSQLTDPRRRAHTRSKSRPIWGQLTLQLQHSRSRPHIQ